MKEIKLTQGKTALVDDWNYEYLNQWKWQAIKGWNTYYVRRSGNNDAGKRTTIYMHRVIMKTPFNMDVDHTDFNGLNCQEYNMVNCTERQNTAHRRSKNKTGFRGVTIKRKSFRASIEINSKVIYLGTYKTKEEAAKAYDKKALELFGSFAVLNYQSKDFTNSRFKNK